MNKKIEDTISHLMELCRQEGVAISGAMELSANEQSVVGFSNKISAKTTQYSNIHGMITSKGDIDEFMLAAEQPFYQSEVDERSVDFTRSNPQVFVTRH